VRVDGEEVLRVVGFTNGLLETNGLADRPPNSRETKISVTCKAVVTINPDRTVPKRHTATVREFISEPHNRCINETKDGEGRYATH
jgi:hypothetical protein